MLSIGSPSPRPEILRKRLDVPGGDEDNSRMASGEKHNGLFCGRYRSYKVSLLIVLGLVHIILSLHTAVPGYLSQDEIFYHWMADSLASRGSLDLWNGYGEFPSPELVHPLATAHGNRIFPPYPYLSAVLAFPFYRIAGFFGLFFLNSLCFVGLAALCYMTARELFHDSDLALNSCFILIFGTFAWEYSQAAWPHCSSALFVFAAFFFFVKAYWADSRRRARCFALVSGLVGGLAVGIRIDCVLVFAGLLIPFLFSRPARFIETLMVLLGALPGLALLAATNFLKFGVFSPLSYGRALVMSHMPGLNVIGPVTIAVFIAWLLTRHQVTDRLAGHLTYMYVGATVLLLVGLVSVTEVRRLALGSLANAYTMLIDIRSLDPDVSFSPMVRSTGGVIIYNNALKKSLLQSLPFLPLLLIPITSLIRKSDSRIALAVLVPIPTAFLVYHSYAFLQLEAGGGLCLNLRYLNPVLPFLSILCAFGIRDLQTGSGTPLRFTVLAAACLCTASVYLLLVSMHASSPDRLEFPLLDMPLLIATMLLLLLAWGLAVRYDKHTTLKTSIRIAIAVAITWAGLVAFFYDYPNHRRPRKVHYGFAEMLLPKIPNNSIFFAGHGFFAASARLLEKENVRIAYPARDNYTDFPKLLAFHLEDGRRAFGCFYRDHWSRMKTAPLKQYSITSILEFPAFVVAEISVPPSDSASTHTR